MAVACQLHILLPNLHSVVYNFSPDTSSPFEREWDRVRDFLVVLISVSIIKQEQAEAQVATKESMLLV